MPCSSCLSCEASENKLVSFQSDRGKGVLDKKSNGFPLLHMSLAKNTKHRNSFKKNYVVGNLLIDLILE